MVRTVFTGSVKEVTRKTGKDPVTWRPSDSLSDVAYIGISNKDMERLRSYADSRGKSIEEALVDAIDMLSFE